MSSSSDDSENIGIALGLVCAAGASTALGAAVVFFPSIVKLASRRVLAASLGFSAGVMTYISFVEIFQKSVFHFSATKMYDEDAAYQLATVCFFAGVIVMMILNWMVSLLLGGKKNKKKKKDDSIKEKKNETNIERDNNEENDEDDDREDGRSQTSGHDHRHHEHEHDEQKSVEDVDESIGGCPCCATDPVAQLEKINRMADEIIQNEVKQEEEEDDSPSVKAMKDLGDISHINAHSHTHGHGRGHGGRRTKELKGNGDDDGEEENQRLVHMGINTAVAIGLHNFPEGLATFVAAINDPAVGAVLAFAIAIHNIPEGLCVALPIYYATGNRMKAFLWALVSGASEFVAALLGWAVLANSFSDGMYATLFGLVAGMMVIISIRELLPTAHFYDPEDTVVTYSFIGGMFLIAASLVLFTL